MNSQILGNAGWTGTKRVWGHGLIAAAAIALLAYANVRAADPAPASPGAKNPPVKLEALPNGVKRVTLTPKAAERLGIATDKVSEQTVVRRQMVGGLVVPPLDPKAMPHPGGAKGSVFGAAPGTSGTAAAQQAAGKRAGDGAFGGFGGGKVAGAPSSALKTVAAPMEPPAPTPSASGDLWILLSMSPAEWERTAKDKPARLIALGTRTALPGELLAKPSGLEPVEDPKRSMLSIYYIVAGKDHGLVLNTRMRVELPMVGPEDKQKVVPYSAIYYDGKGTPWVYVTDNPLVYERQRVAVERVVGDLAVLSEGPTVGTTVVSVGASMLFGTEIFGK
jgi:hypothetical protein